MTLRDLLDAGITIQGNGRITVFDGFDEINRFEFDTEDDLSAYQIPDEMLDLEIAFLYADDVGLNIEIRKED